MIFIFLLSGLFLGWSLGANDAGNVFGAAVETRMIKFKTAAWIASIFVILGAVLQGGGTSLTLNRLGNVNAIAGSFTVAFASAITLFMMVRFKIPVSSSQAVVGAIIGWNIFSGAFTDAKMIIQIVSAWIITPILSALFTIVIFYSFQFYLNRKAVHLLRLDYFTRTALIIVGAFGAFSLGANNIANVMGMFVDSSPFTDIFLSNHIIISSNVQLFFLGALAIAVGIFTYSQKNMKTVGHDLFKLSPLTGLIVVLSSSLVLFIFASKSFSDFLHFLHLPSLPLVPVSSSQAVIGSIIGLSFTKGIQNIQYKILGKISLGWLVNPLISGLLCFTCLFVMQNVFDQSVYKSSYHYFNREVLVELKNRNIDIDRLALVNGKLFKSTNLLRDELIKTPFSKKDKQIIAEVSQVYPMMISHEKILSKIDNNFFSKKQINDLHSLHNQKFMFKWQLINELQKVSDQWLFKKESLKNSYENRELQKKFEIIFKTFYTNNLEIFPQ